MSGRLLSIRRPLWTRFNRLGVVGVLTLIFLIALTIHHHHHYNSGNHYLHPSSPLHQITTAKDRTSHDWRGTCQDHDFSPHPHPQSRKIYDLVLFSTELDWLEIRLHTHSPYIDFFVIVESPTTFTHQPKPLHLLQNWSRFAPFHHQIIHRVVEDPIHSTRHWDHEDFLRNSLLHSVFPSLIATPQEARKDDILLVSDMDELLKPATLLLLKYCTIPLRLTLRSHFYYYSFQFLHFGEQWPHPQATLFGNSVEETLAPNDLRMNLLPSHGGIWTLVAAWERWWRRGILWNAGWHCSSCFPTIQEFQTKMNSFSHQAWNTEENRDAKRIVERVRRGEDLFGREGERYEKVEGNRDVPEYILGEWEREGRFGYLLDRDGEDAGFEDYEDVFGE